MRTFMVVALVAGLGGCKKKLVDSPDGTDPETGSVGDDDDDDTVGDDDDDDDDVITFDAHVIADVLGATYASVGDLDGDGTPEIVVSAINKVTGADIPFGWLAVISYEGDFDSWSRVNLIDPGDQIRSPNHPTLADLDDDGDLDIVLAYGNRFCAVAPEIGPCSGIATLLNQGGGNFLTFRIIDDALPVYTSTAVADFDGDGIVDIAAVAQDIQDENPSAVVQLFAGAGAGSFDPPVNLGNGLGAILEADDVDGDGDIDLLGGEFASGDSFAWFENQGGSFGRRVIHGNFGTGYMIRLVDDLYGDGITRALATNHTNTSRKVNPDLHDSQLIAFDIPANPVTQWSPEVVSDDFAAAVTAPLFRDAPGPFDVGDADGDGDLDILVAGDGDPNVYLIDQTGPGEFTSRVLRYNVGLSGGAHMVDFDGDGKVEFMVTSTLGDSIYVIERN